MEEIKLTIVLDKDGKVHVNGPLTNKIICFGLLEAAKEGIRNFKAPEAMIVPAALVPKP